MVALGIACWPGPALLGMLIYSAAVMAYLAWLGFTGLTGVLLWPAVALHLVLSILLGRAWLAGEARVNEAKPEMSERCRYAAADGVIASTA